ncbi:hypothetical protein ACVI8K_009483 [Bradyrhizobium barranii subsp. barranii]
MRHLRIHRPQVSMITPEEVYNFSFDTIDWEPPPRQAAVVNLGKSDWLNRFAQTHLVRCSLFRLMFYDQDHRLDLRGHFGRNRPLPRLKRRDPPFGALGGRSHLLKFQWLAEIGKEFRWISSS